MTALFFKVQKFDPSGMREQRGNRTDNTQINWYSSKHPIMKKLARNFVVPSLSNTFQGDCFENLSKSNTGLYRGCITQCPSVGSLNGMTLWFIVWQLVAWMAYLWSMNCTFSTTPQITFLQWTVLRKASIVWIQRSHDITINNYPTEHLIDARIVELIL